MCLCVTNGFVCVCLRNPIFPVAPEGSTTAGVVGSVERTVVVRRGRVWSFCIQEKWLGLKVRTPLNNPPAQLI